MSASLPLIKITEAKIDAPSAGRCAKKGSEMLNKEPVGILASIGVTIAVLVTRQLEGTPLEEFTPEIAAATVGIVAMLARRYVVPFIPENLLETFERLSAGTELEDAVVVHKDRHSDLLDCENQLRIINGRQQELDDLGRE